MNKQQWEQQQRVEEDKNFKGKQQRTDLEVTLQLWIVRPPLCSSARRIVDVEAVVGTKLAAVVVDQRPSTKGR